MKQIEIEETKQIVNIHSGAIQIEHKIGLKQRQAWFYMLYKAMPFLNKQTIFTISISELKKAIKYTSRDNQRFKQLLKELVHCTVEWNILNKDKSEIWEANSLLAGCRIEKGSGICKYAYSPFIQKKLCNPEMYAKLNLLISKKFTSKHALAIYCLALDYLQLKQNYGTKILSIEEIRKYLGLKENEYVRVVDMHKHILKKAENEINRDSDMQIEIIPIRASKDKIMAFKLCMSIKENYLFYYLSQIQKALPEPQKNIADIDRLDRIYQNKVEVEVSVIKSEQLKEFLSKYSISLSSSNLKERLQIIKEKLGEERFEDYLLYLINYTNKENSRGIVKTISGFFINLLKDDTQLQNYLYSIERTEKQKKEQEEKINNIYEEKMKSVYNNQLCNQFREYLEENYQQHESLFIEVINKKINPFMKEYAINKKNNGKIDKNLLKNNMVMSLIFEKSELFGYCPIKYEIWKDGFLKEEENKQLLDKLKQEAAREAKIQ